MDTFYRPIKFRAWNKTVKRMIYHSDLYQHVISSEGKGFLYHGIRTGLIPMQFTGLIDANGKEIYEGDVVFAPLNESTYTVRFGLYKTSITYSYDYEEEHYGFYLDRHGLGYYSSEPLAHGDKVQVIGNIYENSDL